MDTPQTTPPPTPKQPDPATHTWTHHEAFTTDLNAIPEAEREVNGEPETAVRRLRLAWGIVGTLIASGAIHVDFRQSEAHWVRDLEGTVLQVAQFLTISG